VHRESNLERLKKESFDVLIIGGGATGAGCALDAATRGLKTALVEKEDFAAETSSRSTKLIHGGIRYLEQAFQNLAWQQYNLVRDALRERATFLEIAPHLCRVVPILTPIYSTAGVPYYTFGLKLYDQISGDRRLGKSQFLGKKQSLEKVPILNRKGLKGSVLYFDGQFDDARMNVSLALTADEQGATICNHVEVTGFNKREGKIQSVQLKDSLTGDSWNTSAKLVINATGPFADKLRQLDSTDNKPVLNVSSGVHIVLGKTYSRHEIGVLIPKTEDGRVLFLLPWLGHTVIGTTDNPAQVRSDPQPTAADVDYLLRHLQKYFSLSIKEEDILSRWCGLRPLISADPKKGTAQLSRDHEIIEDPSGLLSIVGGKWTTYRKMAEDTIDKAVSVGKFETSHPCVTAHLPVVGASFEEHQFEKQLIQEFGLDLPIASHLFRSYGTNCIEVAKLSKEREHRKLDPGHFYLEAEVIYGAQKESARTAEDILSRRTRLNFVNTKAAEQARPKVEELLKEALS